eukprot:CAMPEP_0183515554 /NCGR_PEP_ID=MMETSP0371-20130417/13603_1 /TAXON_ID=268820 /ORGANISM="Peridinium aciculiferum, Strain PAER-2" /LENGTH=193 /DNA_ID=CAMNT_0025713135 /DNA_START=167 /DNA_END=744 /DNA_ORIENTATION=-
MAAAPTGEALEAASDKHCDSQALSLHFSMHIRPALQPGTNLQAAIVPLQSSFKQSSTGPATAGLATVWSICCKLKHPCAPPSVERAKMAAAPTGDAFEAASDRHCDSQALSLHASMHDNPPWQEGDNLQTARVTPQSSFKHSNTFPAIAPLVARSRHMLPRVREEAIFWLVEKSQVRAHYSRGPGSVALEFST